MMKSWSYYHSGLLQASEWTTGDLVLLGVSVILICILIGILYQCAGALTDLIFRGKEK